MGGRPQPNPGLRKSLLHLPRGDSCPEPHSHHTHAPHTFRGSVLLLLFSESGAPGQGRTLLRPGSAHPKKVSLQLHPPKLWP